MGPYVREPLDSAAIEATTDLVIRTLSLPDDAKNEVREAVACSYERTGVSYIDAEIAALPSRFGGPFFDHPAPASADGEGEALIRLVGHYIPRQFAKKTNVFRSIRICPGMALDSKGGNRVGFSYRWKRKDQALSLIGAIMRYFKTEKPDVTWVPVDIEAGRDVTIPVSITVPQETGHYELSFQAVGARFDVNPVIGVDVVDHVEQIPVGQGNLDYGQDHLAGIEYVQRFLDNKKDETILEVASGVNPHLLPLAASGHTVIAGDVCSNQMQLGAIFTKYHHPDPVQQTLGFASFDAFNPPFQRKQFDGVAMFAALHHFPDPAGFLTRLATLVKPGGFITALCEPCDPGAVGEAYLRDLSSGINEQVFSVEEYREIFRQSGLQEHSLRNDNGSLKAILIVP